MWLIPSLHTPCDQVTLPALTLTLAQESGSLVGREFAQSLGARLLVLVSHGAGGTRNLDYILFYIHDNLMKVYNVIFSTVINATCFIMIIIFHDVYSLL